MKIDCDACVMQHTKTCDDCVVSFLVDVTMGPMELGESDCEALGNLAAFGLIPKLRLVPKDTVDQSCRQAPPVGPERAFG